MAGLTLVQIVVLRGWDVGVLAITLLHGDLALVLEWSRHYWNVVVRFEFAGI